MLYSALGAFLLLVVIAILSVVLAEKRVSRILAVVVITLTILVTGLLYVTEISLWRTLCQIRNKNVRSLCQPFFQKREVDNVQ